MRRKDLKDTIKDELRKMLADGQEPSEGRMKLLTLGIKYMAVEAKLEESTYGGFFEEAGDPEAGGSNSQRRERKKSGTRSEPGDGSTVTFDGDEGEGTGGAGEEVGNAH